MPRWLSQAPVSRQSRRNSPWLSTGSPGAAKAGRSAGTAARSSAMVVGWVIRGSFCSARRCPPHVIPAKAGIHACRIRDVARWIPAFAGMTKRAGLFRVLLADLAGQGLNLALQRLDLAAHRV